MTLNTLDAWRTEAEDFRKAEKVERLRRRQIERGDAHDWEAFYVALDQRISAAIDRWFELNPLPDALDQALSDERSDRREQITAAIDDAKRPFETRLAALEQRLDWETGSRCDDRIEAAQARLRDSLIEAVMTQLRAKVCEELRDEFRQAIAAIQSTLETEFAAAVKKVVPSKLPIARAWEPDRVCYRGDVVVHRGATFQATCDTAHEPPHAGHWICLARAGNDAVSFTLRGPLDAKAHYGKFDIVGFDGNSYVARRDNPGIPGLSDG